MGVPVSRISRKSSIYNDLRRTYTPGPVQIAGPSCTISRKLQSGARAAAVAGPRCRDGWLKPRQRPREAFQTAEGFTREASRGWRGFSSLLLRRPVAGATGPADARSTISVRPPRLSLRPSPWNCVDQEDRCWAECSAGKEGLVWTFAMRGRRSPRSEKISILTADEVCAIGLRVMARPR